MKKRNLLLLFLLLMMMPSASGAEELPQVFAAVKEGLEKGMAQGVQAAYAGMAEELTLEMTPENARIEEGKTLSLAFSAGNPHPQDEKVIFSLKLPGGLHAMQNTTWEAILPAAQIDPESGEMKPSVTAFTREVMLMPGGECGQAEIEAEMSMGTRFYRARAALELCVPDVSVSAEAAGTEDGKLNPGDAFAYQIEVMNEGTAAKDVDMELLLPDCAWPDGALPVGFLLENGVIRGTVRAEAAQEEPSVLIVNLPLRVEQDALHGDEDAVRLLAGALNVDGKRVPLPRVQVCSARISAQLLSETDSLQAGETTRLRVAVVNSGLAPADVELSCMLPRGLRLTETEKEKKEEKQDEETSDKTGAVLPPDDGTAPGGAAVIAGETAPAMAQQSGELVFRLHMDAAKETENGVRAETKVIELDVTADTPQENLREQLVGASLAWKVDQGDMQLGEAVAMRVYRPAFLGIVKEDWNGLFFAALLLTVTIGLLYAAVRPEKKEEDFCFE